MGDRALTVCVSEQLDSLRSTLPPGMSAQEWYDDGCPEDVFTKPGANVTGLYAYGYLVGIADALDMTVLEMVEHMGLSLNPPATRQRIRKVATAKKS